jgi:hypothetical protein
MSHLLNFTQSWHTDKAVIVKSKQYIAPFCDVVARSMGS